MDNTRIMKLECRGGDWTDLAEDRVQWQASVNMVMNLWVPSTSVNHASHYCIGT
jgi:hypothetical protein